MVLLEGAKSSTHSAMVIGVRKFLQERPQSESLFFMQKKGVHSRSVVGVMARVEERPQSDTNISRHKSKGLKHMCFYSQGGPSPKTAAEWEPTNAETAFFHSKMSVSDSSAAN